MKATAVYETHFPGLDLLSRGKVRDIYDLGDSLLIVATDRISAFDVVLASPIPDKGKILTQLSDFWLGYLSDITENHLLSTDVSDYPPACAPYASELAGRSMHVRKAKVFPVECIVRGYLAGSGWKDYLRTGKVCGIPLPSGFEEAQRLPEPLFTPSTKAERGEHDENISFLEMARRIGQEHAERIRDLSLRIYGAAARYALERGIILADVKFEFGLYKGRIILVDELLTPDSSRFWPADHYQTGCSPESYDKQYVRDYLVQSGWKVSDPPPELPPSVVENTRKRYLEALFRLSGRSLEI